MSHVGLVQIEDRGETEEKTSLPTPSYTYTV